MLRFLLALVLTLAACSGPEPTPAKSSCDEVNERLGMFACVHEATDRPTWIAISKLADAVDQERTGKWLAPAVPDARLPDTTFVNATLFQLHSQFLGAAWPDAFPNIDNAEYSQLVLYDDREMWSGKLVEMVGGTYAFTVWDFAADPSQSVSYEDVLGRWLDLSPRVPGPLAFLPNSLDQEAAAASWVDPAFPIVDDSAIAYEPYTQGVGFGTVRRFTLDELLAAEQEVAFGHTDILVLEEAPFDIERPIAGAVTGTRQGELSHLNVRSAARGTPNCFVRDPLGTFATWDGKLVRFECGADRYSIEETTLHEAEAWWEEIRPDPVVVPAPDLGPTELVPLLQLPTDTVTERQAGVAAYGSKGTNLATLYQRLDPQYQLDGFVVPMHHYDAFMSTSGWIVDLGQGAQWASFAETLNVWLDDAEFVGDGALRRQRLLDLQEAMEQMPVDADLVQQISDEITAVFGSANVMVRVRSSSNAEDSLSFSGAGLYDSTSICALDEPEDDESGCDPTSDGRTIERGLRRVWASLWGVAAYEEREWYGIDPHQVAMGVLVNTRSEAELAEAVAFTGSPSTDDDRTWIDSQIGEVGVVAADPGVYAETTAVTLSSSGEAERVDRIRGSSELEVGHWVLEIPTVTELAEVLWQIEQVYPVDESAPSGSTVLLDTEWKLLADGRLVIKQVRPFLR